MKVLIFTASTGGGHKRAAAALKEYFETHAGAEVMVKDGLELGGRLYNGFVVNGYYFVAKHTPKFFGAIYRSSDKKSPMNGLCNSINNTRKKSLLPVINSFSPDVIISCHSFVTTMLGELKKKKLIDVPVISLITDFKAHLTYISEGVDHYVVSSPEMVDDFKRRYGVERDKVHPFGIPVFERFAAKTDKRELRKKLGLDQDKKTVLFMAGSFGVASVMVFYKEIASKLDDCQVVVITGNNKKLYDEFEKVALKNTKLLMFVNNVEDYMHSSDLIITKPGGLTVSESLQCRLPMAIYSAYPGQETDNAEYLCSKGAAVVLDKNPADVVRGLISNENSLEKMRRNCEKIYEGHSSEKILNLIKSIITE